MTLKNESLYNKYKPLLFSIGLSVSMLVSREKTYFFGWFIFSIAFSYLATFFEGIVKNKNQKTVLSILSYVVPIGVLIYGLVFRLF